MRIRELQQRDAVDVIREWKAGFAEMGPLLWMEFSGSWAAYGGFWACVAGLVWLTLGGHAAMIAVMTAAICRVPCIGAKVTAAALHVGIELQVRHPACAMAATLSTHGRVEGIHRSFLSTEPHP